MTKDTSQIKDNSQMGVGTGPPSTFHQPPAGVGAGQPFPSVILSFWSTLDGLAPWEDLESDDCLIC